MRTRGAPTWPSGGGSTGQGPGRPRAQTLRGNRGTQTPCLGFTGAWSRCAPRSWVTRRTAARPPPTSSLGPGSGRAARGGLPRRARGGSGRWSLPGTRWRWRLRSTRASRATRRRWTAEGSCWWRGSSRARRRSSSGGTTRCTTAASPPGRGGWPRTTRSRASPRCSTVTRQAATLSRSTGRALGTTRAPARRSPPFRRFTSRSWRWRRATGTSSGCCGRRSSSPSARPRTTRTPPSTACGGRSRSCPRPWRGSTSTRCTSAPSPASGPTSPTPSSSLRSSLPSTAPRGPSAGGSGASSGAPGPLSGSALTA
mmetsp:Transcript_30669/g.77619  ORF Transcript_30669/g.77619 Transcript_30669/m.77619 type:complete len:312 (+) Transcript_30669:169-1104(+)